MPVSQDRLIPKYQPFQCLVCQKRFTRHENLKRHSALHSRSQAEASLPCDSCQVTFSRPDLYNRHMKRKHPEHEHQRVTKRSQRQRSESRQNRVNSVSPTAISPTESNDGIYSPHSMHSPNSSEGCEKDMSNELWHFAMRYPHQHSDRDPRAEHTNLATSAPATSRTNKGQVIAGSVDTQHSTGDSVFIDQVVHDATDLERGLLMGTASLKPIDTVDARMRPMSPMSTLQSVSNDSTLAEINLNQAFLSIPDRFSPDETPQLQDNWCPTPLQIDRGCDLFFANVSHFLPFLHQPTFNPSQTATHLVLSMLCLAYQHGEDPESGDQEGSGESFSIRCFHQAHALIISDEGSPDALSQNTTMIQSYLLLQICAMMYLCGDNSASGLKMHSNMISLARAGKMTQPQPVETGATADLESLWREFVKAESHKRTLFALHQIDALWYQFLSIPRSISHLEIKHELPCPEDQWTSSSSTEWAHRQLVARNPGPSVQYTEAVRLFLSPDSNLDNLPAFDPYGAVNVAQFLISSAREISGWSTMTGMLSMDRFAALRSSLVALSPYICLPPINTSTHTKNATSCAATWEIAMIELQMWSPSHTGGIVEGSIDAVLTQSTYLGPSSQFPCDLNTAKAIQPHVNWFLRYLAENALPDSEAPWVTLYAYKAFLIAWQLMHAGLSDAMETVGVHYGDVQGALIWARGIFQRRQKWQIGKLILSCLDKVSK